MQTRIQKQVIPPLQLSILFLASIIFQPLLLAQETDFSGEEQMIADGSKHTVFSIGESHQDLYVPENTSYSYLYLRVEGADGGKRQVKESDGATRFTVNGGEGATMRGLFKIGTGDKEIPPGSQVRFIIGLKGRTRTDQGVSGCGGGGGTGVLFKKPNQSTWNALVVAGGGGGAYSNCCGDKHEGKQALAKIGTIGLNDSFDKNSGMDAGSIWSVNSEPFGGKTGDYSNEAAGGWGFGGGGKGKGFGGGGGGFFGGSLGVTWEGGSGGSSYVNAGFKVDALNNTNGTTSDTQDGFVEYEFRNNPQIAKEIQSAAASNKCLDLLNGNTANYTTIQLYRCTGRSPQQWIFDGRQIRLAKDPTKCVNLKGGNMKASTDIQLRDCYDKARQDWIYDGFSGAFRSGKNPKHCMNLKDGDILDDTNVQIAACDDGSTQQWLMEGVTLVDNTSGVKTIHLASDTDMCLDLYNGDTDNSTSQVQLYQCTGRSPQQWVFDDLRIKYNAKQEKCLNLDAGDTSNGTKIKVRDCYDKDRQVWFYDGISRSFRSAINPDKCLQVKDQATTNDTPVVLYDCDGSDAQQWVIEG